MFLDSPFERCPVCDRYVLLDQTAEECEHENRCNARFCPLQRFFTGHLFETTQESTENASRVTTPS